jgi:hypothetical protein
VCPCTADRENEEAEHDVRDEPRAVDGTKATCLRERLKPTPPPLVLAAPTTTSNACADAAPAERERERAALDAALRKKGGYVLALQTLAEYLDHDPKDIGSIVRGRSGERFLVIGSLPCGQRLPVFAIDADCAVFQPRRSSRRARRGVEPNANRNAEDVATACRPSASSPKCPPARISIRKARVTSRCRGRSECAVCPGAGLTLAALHPTAALAADHAWPIGAAVHPDATKARLFVLDAFVALDEEDQVDRQCKAHDAYACWVLMRGKFVRDLGPMPALDLKPLRDAVKKQHR